MEFSPLFLERFSVQRHYVQRSHISSGGFTKSNLSTVNCALNEDKCLKLKLNPAIDYMYCCGLLKLIERTIDKTLIVFRKSYLQSLYILV
jgi:hypothetical protein